MTHVDGHNIRAYFDGLGKGTVKPVELQNTGHAFSDTMRQDWQAVARCNRDVLNWKPEWLKEMIEELKEWASRSHEDWCHVRDYLAAAAEEARRALPNPPEVPSRFVFSLDEIVWNRSKK